MTRVEWRVRLPRNPATSRMLRDNLPKIDLPLEIAALIWQPDAPMLEKLPLLFEVYDKMPAYGHLGASVGIWGLTTAAQ